MAAEIEMIKVNLPIEEDGDSQDMDLPALLSMSEEVELMKRVNIPAIEIPAQMEILEQLQIPEQVHNLEVAAKLEVDQDKLSQPVVSVDIHGNRKTIKICTLASSLKAELEGNPFPASVQPKSDMVVIRKLPGEDRNDASQKIVKAKHRRNPGLTITIPNSNF